jgi:sigma-B regulation protein RsbU (phosphoserine phosphatase)
MSQIQKGQIDRDQQLYQLTTLVAGNFSLQEVLDKLAEAAVKIIGVKACSIRLLDEEAGELKMRSTYGLSEEYRNKGVVSKNDPVVKAAFDGEAVVLDDMRIDGRVQYKEATIKEGLVSQLTVAMRFKDKPIGVLRLYSPRPKHFDNADISLARAVASQCAVAITNARLYAEALEGERMAEQVRLAGVIQRRMIPEKAPVIEGLDVAADYIPCFDVGGDLYTFLRINEHRIALSIADVIGKGIPAALMMSWFRGAMHAYVDAMRSSNEGIETFVHVAGTKSVMEKTIRKINKIACNECRDGEFITLFHCSIDVREMTITYCNCGHEPTVLIRGNKVINLEGGGLVLGIDPNSEYKVETLNLMDGDCLLFYTDGLIDAANYDGDLWGRERMLETVKMFKSCPAEQMIKNILGYRRRFVGLASQCDDTSIIAVRVTKGSK